LLTPMPHVPWGFKRESLYLKDGVLYGKMDIEWDGEYQEPPVDLPQDGQFKEPYELEFLLNSPDSTKVGVVKLSMTNFSQSGASLETFYKELPPFDGTSSAKIAAKENGSTLIEYLLFAFLGGLILNLMPCVLPVISIK